MTPVKITQTNKRRAISCWISGESRQTPLAAWEVTSSGLTQEWKNVSPNKNRIGQFINKVNYGALNVDWEKGDSVITLGLYDEDGDVVNEHRLRLSTLEPYE